MCRLRNFVIIKAFTVSRVWRYFWTEHLSSDSSLLRSTWSALFRDSTPSSYYYYFSSLWSSISGLQFWPELLKKPYSTDKCGVTVAPSILQFVVSNHLSIGLFILTYLQSSQRDILRLVLPWPSTPVIDRFLRNGPWHVSFAGTGPHGTFLVRW